MPVERVCRQCGETYRCPPSGNRHFCSKACFDAFGCLTVTHGVSERRADIRTVYGLRYFPKRKWIPPLAPLSVRDRGSRRARNYIALYRKLMKTEPDRIVTETSGDDHVVQPDMEAVA